MEFLIAEIIKKRPDDNWLKQQLDELKALIQEIRADRNRLIKELSEARTEASQLRDEIFSLKLGRS